MKNEIKNKFIINVKVKTNSKKNEVKKINDNSFEVNTTAIPIEGQANDSVIELLSKYFNIGKTKINILKGEKHKLKVIEIFKD